MHDIMSVVLPIAVAHVIVLAVLLIIIRQLLVGDTKRAITRINEVEAQVRKKETAIRREIQEHEKDLEKRKEEAEKELQRRKDALEKEVAALKEQMVSEAKKESAKIIEQARKNEAKFRSQISQEMEEKAVEYGAEVFRLVFSDQMGRALHRQFIDELMDALDEIEGASITVDGEHAEFMAAHMLDDDQKERFKSILKEKFNVDVEIKEKIDHELLAGLLFKLGSLEIDGTLRTRFKEAADEVKKMAHQSTAEI